MNVADRAVQAYEAKLEADAAQQEAKKARQRAEVIETMGRKAEAFGVEFDPEGLTDSLGRWEWSVPVDDDAELVFTFRFGIDLEATVKPCDQLYWDLPPGEEKKGPGGGSYGCFGLGGDKRVGTLAQLGERIVAIRKAREDWRKKHGMTA